MFIEHPTIVQGGVLDTTVTITDLSVHNIYAVRNDTHRRQGKACVGN